MGERERSEGNVMRRTSCSISISVYVQREAWKGGERSIGGECMFEKEDGGKMCVCVACANILRHFQGNNLPPPHGY